MRKADLGVPYLVSPVIYGQPPPLGTTNHFRKTTPLLAAIISNQHVFNLLSIFHHLYLTYGVMARQ